MVVGQQRYFHVSSRLSSGGLHANVRHLKACAIGGLKLKLSINIGHGTRIGAYNLDGSSDYGFAVFCRRYDSADLCLCQHHSYAKEQCGKKH